MTLFVSLSGNGTRKHLLPTVRQCRLAMLVSLCGGLLAVTCAVPVGGQEPDGTFQEVIPAFRDLFPPDARIEKLAGGFQFTEGPVWNVDGYLLFSDIPANAIKKWSPEGGVTIFRKPSGSPNGLTYDRDRRLIVCEQSPARVTRLEPDGTITVLAERYEGKRITSPNDVVVKSDGSIYFTAPPSAVYRLSPQGQLTLLVKDFSFANGLAFSPDERFLYVADTPRGHIRVFDAAQDGTLANGRLFVDMKSRHERGPDGIKVDKGGNVFCAGQRDGVWVFDPKGTHLGTLKLRGFAANCAWGDTDGKSLYITAETSLFRVRVNTQGVRP